MERILSYGQSKYLGGWGQTANTQNEHFHIHTFQRAICAPLPSVITNVSISAFSPIVLSFILSYVMSRNYLLHADGGLSLSLQHKLVFLLPYVTFTVSFTDSVITTDNVKWLQQTARSLI